MQRPALNEQIDQQPLDRHEVAIARLGRRPGADDRRALADGALMGQLHARLHNLAAARAIRERFPDCPIAADIFAAGLEGLADDADVDELRRLLDQHGAGDAACHGDFHPSNVFVVTNGNIVLDWSDSYLGPAESDVAGAIIRGRAANPDPAASPEETERFQDNLELMLRGYLRAYVQTRVLDRVGVEAWVRLVAAHTLARRGRNEGVLRAHLNGEFTLPGPEAQENIPV